MEKKTKIKSIVYFHRKPRLGNFSVENLFKDIRDELSNKYDTIHYEAKYYSNGLLKRLLLAFDFMKHQGDINHVTGDINFSNFFLDSNKTILTILDVGYIKELKGIKLFLIKFFWITLPIKRAKYITTISNSSKKEILEYASCDPSKIKVIYVPINDNFKFKEKSFNQDKPVILQVGTKENKNLKRLIQAIEGIKCHLNIIGSLSEDLLVLLSQKNIEYTNYINLTSQDVIKVYSESDLLTFVSTYEGFGMPIIEANLIGRAVITSTTNSMPEVAGNAATLVNPYSIEEIRAAILKNINNSTYRNLMIKNGFENAKRFSKKVISNEYSNLYEEVFNHNTKNTK